MNERDIIALYFLTSCQPDAARDNDFDVTALHTIRIRLMPTRTTDNLVRNVSYWVKEHPI